MKNIQQDVDENKNKNKNIIYHRDKYAAIYLCSRDSWKIFKYDIGENKNIVYHKD